MFGISKNDIEFINYIHGRNVENIRFFSLAVCAICVLLFFISTGPSEHIKYSYIINQLNISITFFIIYLLLWFILNFVKNNIPIQKFAVWSAVISAYVFSSTLSYLSVAESNGITGFAIAHLMIAVLFSARIAHFLLLLVINGAVFIAFAAQIENTNIVETWSGIIVVIFLSILVTVSLEKQRREVFNSDKKLKQKIEELNNALDVKSTFFGHMSHELRTPLNAIIGFSDMLKNQDLRPQNMDKVIEYADYINTGGNHLLALVNDLLDQNKIETGEISITMEKVNIVELLQNYINELKPLSDDKKQTIEYKELENTIEMNTDRRLFKQIVYNILSNAIRYTPHEGIIRVFVNKTKKDQLEIIVKDSGKGMPSEVINQLTDTEKSAKSHFISNSEGTGLGLIIVRQLMSRLNGHIEIISEKNIGTEIKLTFPV